MKSCATGADLERLDRGADRGRASSRIDTETDSLDPMQADLVGVSLAVAPEQAAYVPLPHRPAARATAVCSVARRARDQIDEREALARAQAAARGRSRSSRSAHNVKYRLGRCSRCAGIALAPFDDTMLMSYVLDAGRSGHGMRRWPSALLNHRDHRVHGSLIGSGQGAEQLSTRCRSTRRREYAAEDADVDAPAVARAASRACAAERMTTVYETAGAPAGRRARRAWRGAASPSTAMMLVASSGDFAAARAAARSGGATGARGRAVQPRLAQAAGRHPVRQDGPAGRHEDQDRRSGPPARDVLDELAEQGHELPQKILDWRQARPSSSRPTPTRCRATSTRRPSACTPPTRWRRRTTGRLSSTEPNLQNIPIRTEEGRKIRTRLRRHKRQQAHLGRLLARSSCGCSPHIADIPALKQAFEDGLDIHAMTATEMFGVPVEGHAGRGAPPRQGDQFRHHLRHLGVRPRQPARHRRARRPAPTSRSTSSAFPASATTWTRPSSSAASRAMWTTLFGRKCHYPDIKSRNPSERAFVERAAINAPIQGTAADIIRRAMVRMEPRAGRSRSSTPQMLLQVHDELIFEVPDGEVEKTLPVVRQVMEEAPLPAVAPSVPLQVDCARGRQLGRGALVQVGRRQERRGWSGSSPAMIEFKAAELGPITGRQRSGVCMSALSKSQHDTRAARRHHLQALNRARRRSPWHRAARAISISISSRQCSIGKVLHCSRS